MVRKAAEAYVSICRGAPIVILLFVDFTRPEIGIRFNAFWAGVFGLSINLGPRSSECLDRGYLGGRFAIDAGGAFDGPEEGGNPSQDHPAQAAIIAVPTVGGYFISLLKDCASFWFISVDEVADAMATLTSWVHLPHHGCRFPR